MRDTTRITHAQANGSLYVLRRRDTGAYFRPGSNGSVDEPVVYTLESARRKQTIFGEQSRLDMYRLSEDRYTLTLAIAFDGDMTAAPETINLGVVAQGRAWDQAFNIRRAQRAGQI